MDKKPMSAVAEPSTRSANARRFSDEFKRDAVRLITEERYTFKAAAAAVGVSEKSLRDWHARFAPHPTPCGEDATVEELRQENKRLRQQLKRAERHERIQQAVRQVHAESHGIYGRHKIAEVLDRRDDLESACRNTVAATMRELGLASKVAKTFKPTTTQADPTKQPAENTLDRDFTAEAPNRKWVTDITYLPTATGWVYLAVVIDLFSRKVVGWSLRALGIECSMSRTGCCYDNAAMERFFWSLKHEWTNHTVRIHQTLGYRSPNQYEAEHAPAQAA